jgi:hypothetical protein
MTIAEQGGPTTTGGTSYQAWVAAWHLAQLLLPVRNWDKPVVEVRLEGRSEVDDVEIQHADEARVHVQAKRRITVGSREWKEFWQRARIFTETPDSTAVLAVGEGDERWEGLATAIERARAARDAEDFEKGQRGIVKDAVAEVAQALDKPGSEIAMRVLARTRIERATEAKLRERVADCLPESSVPPQTVATALAEIANANGIERRIFTASVLRDQLAARGITVTGPQASLLAYLEAMGRSWANVGVSDYIHASAEDAFVWPTLEHPVLEAAQDRFAEHRSQRGRQAEDPRSLLDSDGRHTLIVAGSGSGKSTLLEGLARQALSSGRIPVIVSLPVYAHEAVESQLSLVAWIDADIQHRFDVSAPWAALAARGELCLLFDGLDEIPRELRVTVLGRLQDFTSQYPRVPWVMATRDSGAVSIQLMVKERTLGPIAGGDRERFLAGYLGQELAAQVERALHLRRTLADLATLPLFAIMVAGYVRHHGVDNLPPGPRELLEDFVENALGSRRGGVEFLGRAGDLRRAAEQLAYSGIGSEQQIWSSVQARREIVGQDDPDAVLEDLRRAGLLLRVSGNKWRFVLPIVQEYLAGTHLADVAPARVTTTMLGQATRPWAQTAQFALVALVDADETIETVLAAPDDTFGTNLLAVGRAIAWGARVGRRVRAEVGERLMELYLVHWTSVTSDLEEILEVAYAKDPPKVLLARLRRGGFGPEVFNRLARAAPDETLLVALEQSLSQPYGWIPPTLDDRIVELGEAALERIERRVRESPEPFSTRLLRLFAADPRHQPGLFARHRASPLPPRGAVALFAGAGKLAEVEDQLVTLFDDDDEAYGTFPEELWSSDEPARILDRVIEPEQMASEKQADLVWELVKRGEERLDTWLDARLDNTDSADLRAMILASKACLRDDEDAFLALCQMVPGGDSLIWQCFTTCLGKFEHMAGVEALKQLSARELSITERRELMPMLHFSMTCEVTPLGLFGGSGGRERRHPGFDIAWSLARPLADSEDDDPIRRLGDVMGAAEFGIESALLRLPGLVAEACAHLEPLEVDSASTWELEEVVCEAIRILPWSSEHESFLVSIVTEHHGWNLTSAAVRALCSLRERSLEELIGWHNLQVQAGWNSEMFRDEIRNAALREKRCVVELDDGRLQSEHWGEPDR